MGKIARMLKAETFVISLERRVWIGLNQFTWTQHHPIITIFKKYTNDSGTCQLDNHRKCPFLSVPPENHSIIGY